MSVAIQWTTATIKLKYSNHQENIKQFTFINTACTTPYIFSFINWKLLFNYLVPNFLSEIKPRTEPVTLVPKNSYFNINVHVQILIVDRHVTLITVTKKICYNAC